MQTKNKVLFDASALLALIKKEAGYEQLEDLLASSCISAVNLSEVVSVLIKVGVSITEIEEIVNEVIPEVIPFTHKTGFLTGSLTLSAKELTLSLGDRACIATGIINNMIIYTTNQEWQKLQLDNLNIVVIR
jgi:PIN domain nuclease of toxin-antitoxin system